jgi:hypothetical protein
MAPTTSQHTTAKSPPAGHDDLRRIIADLDDATALEILALSPTVSEVEEAAMWARGEGDRLDRAGRPLTGTVADILAVLDRGDEAPEG